MVKLLITSPIEIDGRWFYPYKCYCDYEKEWRELDVCHQCHYAYGKSKYAWHYKVTIDSVDYYIPDYACVETNEVPPEDLEAYRRDRDQDDTTDYFVTVKELMGIDIRKSYVAQHNSKGYIEPKRDYMA